MAAVEGYFPVVEGIDLAAAVEGYRLVVEGTDPGAAAVEG